jgi:hypothetical protein
MKKVVLLLLSSVALFSCAGQHVVKDWGTIDAGPKPEYSMAHALAEEAIKGSLKDPESARFSNWSPMYKNLQNWLGESMTGVWELCVNVYSKHSFGGHVWSRIWFVQIRDGKVVWYDPPNSYDQKYAQEQSEAYLRALCQERSLDEMRQ